MVRSSLAAIGVDYCELGRGAVEKAVRGDKVKRHDITAVKNARQEGNSRQKKIVNVKGNPGLETSAGGRGKHGKHCK